MIGGGITGYFKTNNGYFRTKVGSSILQDKRKLIWSQLNTYYKGKLIIEALRD